jgi:hypothetical protein
MGGEAEEGRIENRSSTKARGGRVSDERAREVRESVQKFPSP